MPRSGGTYTVPTGSDAVANSTASSSAFNALLRDVETALTDSINKDGTKAMAAALAMGSNKITGLAAGAALTDAASVTQVQNNTVQWADGGGTADVITATYTPVITALVQGMILGVRATAANATTTPTFSPNGLTAYTIIKGNGAALAAGDIVGDGHELLLRYDSTNTRWCLLNPFPAAAAGASPADTTTAGISELATTTEVLTGTAATNIAVTPDALAALWEQGSDIASGGTISVGEGGYFHVTGTTTITDIDFGTTKAGRRAKLVFDGILTLTHHSTTLILPTGANITTAAGDTCEVVSEGGDNVRVVNYQRKDGTALATTSVPGVRTVIKKAADESVATSTTLQNDNDFAISLLANTKYLGEIIIHMTASVGGFKFDFTGPAAPTSVSINCVMADSAASSDAGWVEAFSSATSLNLNAGTWVARIGFYISNGANAGTLQFRWAQTAATGTTTCESSSYMVYEVVT
jgi:hypothetical protein